MDDIYQFVMIATAAAVGGYLAWRRGQKKKLAEQESKERDNA